MVVCFLGNPFRVVKRGAFTQGRPTPLGCGLPWAVLYYPFGVLAMHQVSAYVPGLRLHNCRLFRVRFVCGRPDMDARDSRDTKDGKDSRDAEDNRDTKDSRDARDLGWLR